MRCQCVSELSAQWRQMYAVSDLQVVPELCPPEMKGDVTVNCFRLAKACRANPQQLAQEARTFLAAHADVAAVEAIKAFVNVTLQPAALFRDTVAEEAALLAACQVPAAARRHYLVEFSAPNTNKPQHLGHVRNNSLGQAICGILGRAGHRVTPVNLVNDRGIHICKSMLAYQRFGNGITPETAGKKGDHLVGDFYVRFDVEFRRQVAELKAAQPALADQDAEALGLQTEIGRAAQDLLIAWENGDLAVRALWQQMNGWVLAGFAETYRRMGVEFAHTYYESDTYRDGRDVALQAVASGLFQRRADGAVVVDLKEAKLGEKVVLRSDGTSVYVTQDIGTTLRKNRDFGPDAMIWIVGDEQIHHFNVLFAILRKLGYQWEMHHTAYGMVNLPSGRMKSREGTVVDADELFDKMVALAREEILQRCEGGTPPPDFAERAELIAMGAVKFMLLKVSPRTTMLFDPNASIKFEGDTGPYVQYAYARIASITRKRAEHELAATVDWSLLGEPEERAVALRCAVYGEAVQKAAKEFDPAVLAGYLLDLAQAYSTFYNKHSVLSAATPALRRARYELSLRVQAILGDGLRALAIGTPEQM